jgi:hypothetical protein
MPWNTASTSKQSHRCKLWAFLHPRSKNGSVRRVKGVLLDTPQWLFVGLVRTHNFLFKHNAKEPVSSSQIRCILVLGRTAVLAIFDQTVELFLEQVVIVKK